MTPPMTPRESKLQKVQNALASGSGDHAELARLSDYCRTLVSPGDLIVGPNMMRHALEQSADAIEDLIAENAALRAERVHLVEQKEGAEDALFNALNRAVEAGRKLAESDNLNDRAADLMRQCTDPERFEGASTLNVYANMRAWLSDLSKEAERE